MPASPVRKVGPPAHPKSHPPCGAVPARGSGHLSGTDQHRQRFCRGCHDPNGVPSTPVRGRSGRRRGWPAESPKGVSLPPTRRIDASSGTSQDPPALESPGREGLRPDRPIPRSGGGRAAASPAMSCGEGGRFRPPRGGPERPRGLVRRRPRFRGRTISGHLRPAAVSCPRPEGAFWSRRSAAAGSGRLYPARTALPVRRRRRSSPAR